MDIKNIKTEADYEEALEKIEEVMKNPPPPNTAEADEFEILIKLVNIYEEEHYAMELPDPVDYLEYFMDSRGLTQADLVEAIGSSGRVSDIINRNRPITEKNAKDLHSTFGIPVEILFQPFRDDEDISYEPNVLRESNFGNHGEGFVFSRISENVIIRLVEYVDSTTAGTATFGFAHFVQTSEGNQWNIFQREDYEQPSSNSEMVVIGLEG